MSPKPQPSFYMKQQDNEISVVFEDNHLLCVDKPHGIATQEELQTRLMAYIKEKYAKPGNVYLHAVHRLDKPTRGIVIFAKTSKALSRLNEQMRKKGFTKIYTAIVEGTLSSPSGTLEHYLIHGDHKALVARPDDTEAKKCILTYKVVGTKDSNSIVEVELHTGRYHQIRAQFAAIGHPILGDTTYGAQKPYRPHAIALCHSTVTFSHPVTGKELTLSCEKTF